MQVHGGVDSISVAGASAEGAAFGAAVGYELPVGRSMFVGVEGSIDDSTAKECRNDVVLIGGALQVGVRTCASTGRDLSAVVRFGAAIDDRTKLYVLGGYTNARVRETATTEIIQGAPVMTSSSANGDGYRLGLGLERRMVSKLFAKIEYRYSDYEGGFARHNGLIGAGVKF